MTDISNLSDTIIPKSDQLNADQLMGGPMTITVSYVSRGNAEQPITINYDGDNGRPFKPCKTVRKLLVFAWGEDGNAWIGRSMTLYNDPSVMYGGVKVGGIRVSHMSDIAADITVSITATRGKKTPLTVKRLAIQKPVPSAPEIDEAAIGSRLASEANKGTEALRNAWGALSKAEQKAAGKQLLDELKEIAAQADAANVPNESAADESIF